MHNIDLTRVKAFTCEVCGKAFERKIGLQTHSIVHEKNREEYSCETCGQSYQSKQNLENHMRAHTGKVQLKHLMRENFK